MLDFQPIWSSEDRKWTLLLVNAVGTVFVVAVDPRLSIAILYLVGFCIISVAAAFQGRMTIGRRQPSTEKLSSFPPFLDSTRLPGRIAFEALLLGVVLVDAGLLLSLGRSYYLIVGVALPIGRLAYALAAWRLLTR